MTTDAIYLVVKVRRSSRFGAWLDVYVTILNSFLVVTYIVRVS